MLCNEKQIRRQPTKSHRPIKNKTNEDRRLVLYTIILWASGEDQGTRGRGKAAMKAAMLRLDRTQLLQHSSHATSYSST